MKKWTIILILGIISCTKQKPKPLSEIIQKAWVADTVTENGVMVFSKGSTTNIRPGYAQFKLAPSGTNVTLTEFEGSRFSGQLEISSDNRKLTLKNLIPQPTQTNGTIEYTVDSFSEEQLILTRVTANLKTGNVIANYVLVSQ